MENDSENPPDSQNGGGEVNGTQSSEAVPGIDGAREDTRNASQERDGANGTQERGGVNDAPRNREDANGTFETMPPVPEMFSGFNSRAMSPLFMSPRQRQGLRPMSDVVKENWRKGIFYLKIRRALESWHQIEGQPCERCAPMHLTEAKFLISDQSKHRRMGAPPGNTSDFSAEGCLGPAGLVFGPKEYKLGSLQELYRKRDTCPFCRLAISFVVEICNKEMEQFAAVVENDRERFRNIFFSQDVSCYASWQIDGRLLVRDGAGAIIGSKPCTRRIRLRWSPNGPLPETYVVLMATRASDQGLFLGKPLDVVKSDAALIQRWTADCEKWHGDDCRSQAPFTSLTKSFFGVIDIKDMCLTKLPEGERFIALSYTWGQGVTPFRTLRDNVKSLLVPDSLRKWRSSFPRTIRDAMSLVGDLGERYLWVDSLCIIQDSERSWALNSKLMDVVYGNAYLTICAADGKNANAGLRGLNSTAMNEQYIAQYSPEVRLMATQPAENYIRDSVWNTRGWTFQERLLSARNVIFVAGRIFFQCRCTARSTDIITEHESAGWSIEFKDSPLLMLQKLPQQPLSVYKRCLALYLERQLTHHKDILAAFTGIGNRICGALGGELVFGLPSSHFDWALLWEPRDAAVRRPSQGHEHFPSWSWCGWKDEIMEYKDSMLAGCEDYLHNWLMNHTWIVWYIRDGNGNLRRVWNRDLDVETSNKIEPRWRGYGGHTKGVDCTTHDKYGRYIKPHERKLRRSSGFKKILDECPYDVTIVEEVEYVTPNSTATDMAFLQFFTWRAFFRIREDMQPSVAGRKFNRYSILDYKDDWCGTILLDKFWVRKIRNLDEPLEFIAISEAKHFSPEEYDDWANYIPMERQESSWHLYYVLLIQTKEDISYRVGLGKVFKDAFDNSCRSDKVKWDEFILG